MTPVRVFMVAIAGLAELHVPTLIVEANVVVEPTQTFWVPLNVPEVGGAVTVTVRVCMAFVVQPPVANTV